MCVSTSRSLSLSCRLSTLFILLFLLDPSGALAGVRRRPLHLAVLFGRHLGKPLHEGDQVPDFVILVHGSVRSHAGHLDAVLDDPEKLGAAPSTDGVR